MITAVLELASDGLSRPYTTVVFGRPIQRVSTEQGRVCFFRAGQLVALRFTWHNQTRGFLFRTLAADEPYARLVAGVTPSVRLLITAATGRRLERALELLRLVDHDCNFTQLDDLLLRAAPLLAGRARVEHIVSALALSAG